MNRGHWLYAVIGAWMLLPILPGPATSSDVQGKPTRPATAVPTPAPNPAITTKAPKAEPRASVAIEGIYRVDGGEMVVVKRLMEDIYHLRSQSWEGVGILTKSEYRGMCRDTRTGQVGQHLIDWRVPAEPEVHTTWLEGSSSRQRWKSLVEKESVKEQPTKNPVIVPPDFSERPAFGEYVYVEELPEAVTKVPPSYPEAAREAKISGTVMLQALVLKDGSVGDTKILKSIPELDEAAVASVRQWRFKPATAKGAPVAVWVAVPIKFSLH